jgi:hypothetical protein
VTTATGVTFDDLSRLGDLMMALHEAGHIDEANKVAEAYTALQGVFIAEHFPWLDDDDDPEFLRQMEEAEQDIAAGRLIPHDEVMRKLRALDDGQD